MSPRTVRTQAELDAALADPTVTDVDIRSERGVWLEVSGSASVSASGSASVSAWGSASVSASGSASVRASGSASVSAWGSASVSAWDSASVSAWGSASVSAWDSASVSAGSHVAVHLHSGRARVEGGVIIDHTEVDLTDSQTWCGYHGAETEEGSAVVFKAVRDDLRSAHGAHYLPGETTTCDDWADDGECGHGLHVSPHPALASAYDDKATRFLECRVALSELRPIEGVGAAKAKAPAVHVIREVDVHGRPVQGSSAVGAS